MTLVTKLADRFCSHTKAAATAPTLRPFKTTDWYGYSGCEDPTDLEPTKETLMSNMSYCRFQNTSGDFRDCDEALEELIDGASEPLSADELAAAKSLAKRAIKMLQRLAEAADIDVDLDDLLKQVPDLLEKANKDTKNEDDES